MWTGGHSVFLIMISSSPEFSSVISSSVSTLHFLRLHRRKTGLSTHLLARYSFGVKGSWLPSLLLGGTPWKLVWRWRSDVRYSGQ
ncbi:cytosine permease [Salmonella enterica subsp. enterica]|nr:cytosine permease [Salmonella enterica subsp. enterica]